MNKKVLITIFVLTLLFLLGDSVFAYTTGSCPSGYRCTGGVVYYTEKDCEENDAGFCETVSGTKSFYCSTSSCRISGYQEVCTTLTPPCYSSPTSAHTDCCKKCTSGCGSCSPKGTYYSSHPGGNYYISGYCHCTRSNCTSYTGFCYSCDPYTACDCGSLSTSNQGAGSKTITCPNGCGGTASSTCYCKEKCPLTCPQYSSPTPQGTGNWTIDCYNSCNNRNVKTCYCPAATCSDYIDESEIEWYDECPSNDPDDCRDEELEVPILNTPHEDCDSSQTKTCYTTNQSPEPIPLDDETTTNVEIVPASQIEGTQAYSTNLLTKLVSKIKAQDNGWDNIFGYSSNTHSGILSRNAQKPSGLNNPVGLKATYTDSDGQQDIVALYIWWNPSSTKNFPTPDKIANNNAKTNSNQNWGFLIAKEYNQNWNQAQIYAPYIEGNTKTWKNQESIDTSRMIKGSNSEDIVQVSNINIETPNNTNKVNLELILTFQSPTTTKYNIWSQANDYVGFTALLDNGNIKEPNIWEDSEKDWTVDLERPIIENIVTSEDTQEEVNLSFKATDNRQLEYVRVDACYTDIADPNTIKYGNTEYTMEHCNDFSEYLEGIDITTDPSLLGEADELNTNEIEEYMSINLNGNDEGSITFWITAMDKAGNYIQGTQHYRLGQWAVVENGLIYGKNGVHSSTRNLEDNAWDGSTSEIANDNGFEPNTLDLTDQVLLGGGSISTIFLRELVKSNVNNSFKASNFRGVSINSAYTELMNAFSKKRNDLNVAEVDDVTTLSGTATLSEICSMNIGDYCVIESEDDITIESGFVCDGKGLIVSKGDITIDPDITNLDDSISNACILLAGGDINIKAGTYKSSDETHYDIVHAFMIANNKINIPTEDDSDITPDDGLLVEGALIGFGETEETSINNVREIPWGPRTIFPVIAVNNNSKYGLLSKDLFGSQIDIYKTEVGFKPY